MDDEIFDGELPEGITPEGWKEIQKRLKELDRVVIGHNARDGSMSVLPADIFSKDDIHTIHIDTDEDRIRLLREELRKTQDAKTQAAIAEKQAQRLLNAVSSSEIEDQLLTKLPIQKIREVSYETILESVQDEWEHMTNILHGTESDQLLKIWSCLDGYDPHESFDQGISMEGYAVAVHMELVRRKIPHQSLSSKRKK